MKLEVLTWNSAQMDHQEGYAVVNSISSQGSKIIVVVIFIHNLNTFPEEVLPYIRKEKIFYSFLLRFFQMTP